MRTQDETLVHIHSVAARVIATMEREKIFSSNFPGYLRVDPFDGWTLLTVQLGTSERNSALGQHALADRLSLRLDALTD